MGVSISQYFRPRRGRQTDFCDCENGETGKGPKMRGRKPKPTALHKLQGTFNATRHRHRLAEPKPTGDLAEPPGWMTEEQQEAWHYALAHAPAGLLKLIDRSMLAIWIVAEDRHRIAAIMQAKLDEGSEHPLLSGGKDESPYVRIGERAALIIMKAAAELGFTPTSRPRLAPHGGNGRGASVWDQFGGPRAADTAPSGYGRRQ
jgi:phage terminase small subunit